MTSEQLEPLSRWLRRSRRAISSVVIFVANFLKRRKLEVFNVSLGDTLLLKGNSVDIYWNIVGCHKIIIANRFSLLGNTKGVSFPLDRYNSSIEIIFYGVNSLMRKTISLPDRYSVSIAEALETELTSSLQQHLSLKPNLVPIGTPESLFILQNRLSNSKTCLEVPGPKLSNNYPNKLIIPKLEIILPEYKQEFYSK